MPDTRNDSLRDKAAALDTLVEHWFFETVHGSAVARSTETWNTVHGAKEELKRRLAAFIAAEGAD